MWCFTNPGAAENDGPPPLDVGSVHLIAPPRTIGGGCAVFRICLSIHLAKFQLQSLARVRIMPKARGAYRWVVGSVS